MRLHPLGLAACVLLLAGCNRQQEATPAPAPAPEAPAPTASDAPAMPAGFQHDPAFDASGYYMSQTPVQAGTFKLVNIAVGAPSDFSQWEAGSRTVFGPILFQFEDVTSPTTTNEMGAAPHTVSVRVLPASYRMSAGEITFQGSDPKVGQVTFQGAFDAAALAKARSEGASDGATVLTGSLQVGAERIRNISFSYWVGD